ncbi:hypothetical protein LCGC14_0981090 [marine sediment metagenome]|uniref:CR-type domain-containing protein n=1 Tax=marine sediment metagenome TaxID=412755 RepID=A0A0F9NV15_9ZZZZ
MTEELLNPDELDTIQITQDDKNELEEMATIGLTDCEEDHEEYAKRVPYLLEQRLKEKVAKADKARLCPDCLGEKRTLVRGKDGSFNGKSPCPTCQGTGYKEHTPECIKHKAIFGSVGCTCTGYRPDREQELGKMVLDES